MLRGSIKLGNTSHNLSFNSAFVVSSSDLEEALVSPALVPAVGNQPVRSAALNTPTDDLDGVSSQSRSSSMVVNSALIGQEVVVNGEGSLNGAVGHNFSLDLGNLRWDTVNGIGNPFIFTISFTVNAGSLALRSRLRGTARSILASIDVMIARRERIWHAVFGIIVKISSNETSLFPVVHGSGRIASVAAVATAETAAGQQVFG
jgi:hypothetical protein